MLEAATQTPATKASKVASKTTVRAAAEEAKVEAS
jgi:hypothetical protein